MESRIASAFSRAKPPQRLFSRDALRKLTISMHQTESDVRKLLEVAIEVTRRLIVKTEALLQESTEWGEGVEEGVERRVEGLCVEMRDVDAVLKERNGSGVEKAMEKLPRTGKIFAGILARLAKRDKVEFVRFDEAFWELERYLREFKLERMDKGGLRDMVGALADAGLVERVKARKGRAEQLRVKQSVGGMIEASAELFGLWAII